MGVTKCGLVTVTPANSLADMVFQSADWSCITLPLTFNKTMSMAENLYNMPSSNHVCLVYPRAKRKDKIGILQNLSAFEEAGWNALDAVSITYEKPFNCSNNGLLPLAETVYIFYKTSVPNMKQTGWFSESYQNASSHWDVRVQKEEQKFFKSTYCHKFSWEVQMLMMSMVSPFENKRFFYGLPITTSEIKSLYGFCNKYGIKAEVFCDTADKEAKLIAACESVKGRINE